MSGFVIDVENLEIENFEKLNQRVKEFLIQNNIK